MAQSGKKIEAARKQVEARPYALAEAVPLLQKVKYVKFDETVALNIRLGVDPRHADQMVRGTVVLPHGLGKSKRVLVIAGGDKQAEAQAAGADFVGGEEMVDRIQKEGWVDYDAVIATPDMMRAVGKLGKVLGPRGLMPNPKTGTVTMDVARAVGEFKGGRVEYRTDKIGNVQLRVGKVSFASADLVRNVHAVLDELVRAKPSSSKGRYLLSVTVSSTMGPGVKIDPARARDVEETLTSATA